MIYLKNGEKKFGMIMERPHDEQIQFLSSNQVQNYLDSGNESLLENISYGQIESIDIDLK
jgi:hypothetical protein